MPRSKQQFAVTVEFIRNIQEHDSVVLAETPCHHY